MILRVPCVCVQVWDLRMYGVVHDYFTSSPGVSLDVSQRGLVAVSMNGHVQVWKDALTAKATAPYLRHSLPGKRIESARFRPFEDILGLGHSTGVSSMVRTALPLCTHVCVSVCPLSLCRARGSPTTTHWRRTHSKPPNRGGSRRFTRCWVW